VPSDGAKACQARIAITKKTLCSILPSVVGLPEKLSTWKNFPELDERKRLFIMQLLPIKISLRVIKIMKKE